LLSKATHWLLRVQFLTRGRICMLPSHSEWICWQLNLLSSGVKQLQCIADHSCLWHHQKLNTFIYYIHTYIWHNYIHNLCALYTYSLLLLLMYMHVYIITPLHIIDSEWIVTFFYLPNDYLSDFEWTCPSYRMVR